MYVSQLVVNDVSIPIGFSKPTGLEKIKASLERDFIYSGIDTKIDVELSFHCDNGKEAIDAEYESKGVEGAGYVEITDICGETELVTRFKLDFRKYSTNSDKCSVGLEQLDLIEGDYLNWKEDLNKEVNLSQIVGLEQDFYVRNLPIVYSYNILDSEMSEKLGTTRQDLIWPPLPTYPIDWFYIFQKANTDINQLEEGSLLLANQIVGGEGVSYRPPVDSVVSSSNGVFATSFSQNLQTTIELQPLFDNILDDGEIDITTSGDNGVSIEITDTTYAFQYARLREHFIIGNAFDNPRLILECHLFGGTTPVITSFTNTSYVNNFVTGTHTEQYHTTYLGLTGNKLNVKKGEKVWHYYSFVSGNYSPAAPITINGVTYSTATALRFINYKEIKILINRLVDIKFRLTKNVANSVGSSSDIEPYHTKVKAYQGRYALNEIFKTNYNIAYSNCYNDLWFTKGDKLRNKINSADFIVKPSDFFRELEKVVCCGLGIFYDSSGNPSKELRSVFEFYTDNLQNIFQESDIIDGDIKIEPYPNVFFKDIQIGYSNSKNSPYELSKQNDYSIDNISTNSYSKVSDFIASQYIITKAMKLGSEDKEKEFDKNIFILSGTEDSGYNVTLSQTSGYLADNIFVNTNNVAGINRRYATVLNLFRHLYKWGFSLFAGKEKLTANKYEGNSIYTEEIRDTVGSSTNPYYPGLSPCMLPLDNYVKTDKTIDDIYLHIQSDLYVPSIITFKTNKYTSVSLLNSRNTQYDLYKVSLNGVDYYGNLISAILEDDVTEIKLLRRFKNGL